MSAAPVLVVGDEQGNSQLVFDLLKGVCDDLHCSCDPSMHAADLADILPGVLVLTFTSLDASVAFLEKARQEDETLALRPHVTVALCDKHDVQKAFALCRDGVLDDYVLFWPVSHDGPRLPMAVTMALRSYELKAATAMRHPPARRTRRAEKTNPAAPSLRPEREAVVNAMRSFLESRLQAGMDPEADTATAAAAPVREEQPGVVLFVEDARDQHAILKSILAGTELTPVFSTTTTGAMQILKTMLPGIILVDVNLPDGSGVDLIRSIRADAVFSQIPIITVTGNSTRDVVLAAISAGTADFVAKPYSKNTLLAKLRRVMKRPEQATAL